MKTKKTTTSLQSAEKMVDKSWRKVWFSKRLLATAINKFLDNPCHIYSRKSQKQSLKYKTRDRRLFTLTTYISISFLSINQRLSRIQLFWGQIWSLAILKAKILLQTGLTCYFHICVKSKYPNLSWLSSEYHLAKLINTCWLPAAMVGWLSNYLSRALN